VVVQWVVWSLLVVDLVEDLEGALGKEVALAVHKLQKAVVQLHKEIETERTGFVHCPQVHRD
jgi:hypothetical protein